MHFWPHCGRRLWRVDCGTRVATARRTGPAETAASRPVRPVAGFQVDRPTTRGCEVHASGTRPWRRRARVRESRRRREDAEELNETNALQEPLAPQQVIFVTRLLSVLSSRSHRRQSSRQPIERKLRAMRSRTVAYSVAAAANSLKAATAFAEYMSEGPPPM